jgi:photosystem II stability/assembly factor-like uncharacterized protein
MTYFAIQVVTPQISYLVGPGLYLMNTLDGAKTWKILDKRGGGVQFIDAQHGWRVISSEVLRTTDGGLTWESRLKMPYDAKFPYNSFYFVDSMTGWVVTGGGIIWHTSDGGVTWEQQKTEVRARLNDIYFINSYCGWIVGNTGIVLRTCDGGNTWESGHVGVEYALGNVQFFNENVGRVVGVSIAHSSNGEPKSDVILHSIDGGRSWSVQANLGNSGSVRDLLFINQTRGWSVGKNGLIMRTSDGGKSWTRQQSGTLMHLNSVSFIDENTGWAVGGWDEDDLYKDETGKPREGWNQGIILRTTNGGQTWEKITPPLKR